MGKRLEFALESFAITTLVSEIRIQEFGGLDLQPSYQRNYIWKNDFKDKLIYSIVKSYPIGNIIIRQLKTPNEKGAKSEIVDGQQRLTTIYDFVEGNYVIHSDVSRKIIEAIEEFYGDKTDKDLEKLKKKLNNKGNIKLMYSDFPPVIKGKFEAFNISVTKVLEADEDDVTEYFRFLQNQERLRAGEILGSLTCSKMEKYLLKINNKQSFCNTIKFNNDRKEFDKLFYNIIGVLDSKITLGSPDSVINRYVTSSDTITYGQKEIENLIYQINKITDINAVLNSAKTVKKRYVKFLMLLMGFGFIDFTTNTEKKLKILEEIDNKFSVFFSSTPYAVKNEFLGYSNEIIEDFRSIALISKGAQTLERVKNRMEILAYYIENFEERCKSSGIEIL